MKKTKKLRPEEILKFDGKRAIIGTITQIVDDELTAFFVVKIGGIIFYNNNEYRWKTRKEAEEARERIKKHVREMIKKIKKSNKGEKL